MHVVFLAPAGAKIGDRTRDLILTMDVLYQLSYLGLRISVLYLRDIINFSFLLFKTKKPYILHVWVKTLSAYILPENACAAELNQKVV